MTPVLNAVGIVTSEMARSLAFYRHLGLDVPDTPEEGHVNIDIADGIRLMIDSEAEIRKFRPDWERKTGNQLALAFQCESASQVDEVYARMTAAGFRGDKEPWNAFWDSGTRSFVTLTEFQWICTPPSDRAVASM